MIELRGEEVGEIVSRLDIRELDTDDTPDSFSKELLRRPEC